jgi:hypothetical protein
MAESSFKIRNLYLLLLYLCLDREMQPLEVTKLLGKQTKSSYDRNISKYLNKLEKEGLMTSRFKDDKKYFKANKNKIAKIIIKNERAYSKKAKEFFKEERGKVQKGNAPKGVKKQMISSLKPRIKLPTKKEAIEIFRNNFEVTGDGEKTIISLKKGNSVPYGLKKIAEIKKHV